MMLSQSFQTNNLRNQQINSLIMRRKFRVCVLLLTFSAILFPQSGGRDAEGVYVDGNGVLRWKASHTEVSLFGVNYTAPFAYAYRAHKRLGLSIKKAIDLDVDQMARLGFDAFRVHVWDREISDSSGNVLSNEHLDLFDYLLAKLGERGIKIVVTPIAWWGIGWPEPDVKTQGFSQHYPRLELITNPRARIAERNYLKQFVNHRNRYRGLAYKDDQYMIAVEVINEPTHPQSGSEVTDYINDMVRVLREAGFAKPIFYNISQNWSEVQANAVTRSEANGVSFQWYPTDLVHGRVLTGNYLPNVSNYVIPSAGVVDYGKKAKMVYEFDAADVGGSYMYPAIARSFREAGMQFATMFSYDPTQIAWSNTEYPTHFVNLLYAPSKALSLMIAAKAFRKLPRTKSFGIYPENNRFDDFRVSYAEDLSEMNGMSEFLYSNSTCSVPKDPGSLKHVAGCGNSPIVRYDGTGAYFFDKLEDGIWRLEVYPDVLWLRDPFEAASMSRQVARLFWREREMRISIPDLGTAYSFHSMSDTKRRIDKDSPSKDSVWPGVYIVAAERADKKKVKKYLATREPFLGGLYAPPAPPPGISVVNKSSQYIVESGQAGFKFQIAGEEGITNAYLFVKRLGWRGFSKHKLENVGGFSYALADTPKILQSGMLEYCVGVEVGKNTYTFPEGIRNAPGQWDFSTSSLWNVKVVRPDEPIALLDVRRDRRDFTFPHYNRSMRYSVDYKNGSNSEETALALKVTLSDENKTPFGFQLDASGLVKSFAAAMSNYRHVAVKARSGQDSTCRIGIVFVLADGTCYGADAEIKKDWQVTEIPLSAFRSRSALMLPDSYPLFLPKVRPASETIVYAAPDLRTLESIQIILGSSGTKAVNRPVEINLEIASVILTN